MAKKGELIPLMTVNELTKDQLESLDLSQHKNEIFCTTDENEVGGTGGTGEAGFSPTIDVSKSGSTTTLTITDVNGTKTATINDGAKGDKGDTGSNGVSATHSWNGTTLTITSASGTSSANLKGDKGDTGETGAKGTDGYTPVKGTDYWTEADKTEIKNYVADTVPTKTSQLTNDSMFVDSSQVNSLTVETVNSQVEELKLVNEQEMKDYVGNSISNLSPEFVDSIDQMTDTSKKYVLSSDGYIYAWMKKKVKIPHNAKNSKGTKNARCSANNITVTDGEVTEAPIMTTSASGLYITWPIPVGLNKTSPFKFIIKGVKTLQPNLYDVAVMMHFYKQDGTYINYASESPLNLGTSPFTVPEDGFVIDMSTANSTAQGYFNESYYVRVTLGIKVKNSSITDADIANLVINCPNLDTEEEIEDWYSTNQKYSSDEALSQIAEDVADVITRVEELEKGGGSGSVVSSGANWFAMGDSITYGGYDNADGNGYRPPVVGKRWVDYVAKYNGYNLTNYGVSGSGFLTGKTLRTIVNEIVAKDDTENFKSANLVTIMLGINDWKNYDIVNQMGTMEDDVQTGGTIISECRYCLETIIAQNPLCKIFLITPLNAKLGGRGTEETNWGYGFAGSGTVGGSLKQFGDGLKEVCEYYGIQVIDMTNSSVVNRKSITTVLGDGLHPTLDGYKAIGLELARKITFA